MEDNGRLPEWAYSDTELIEYTMKVASDVHTTGDILLVKIYGPNGDTGKCMILHGSADLVHAVDKVWSRTKLILMVDKVRPGISYIDYLGFIRVLDKLRYETKFPDMPFANRVFHYKPWMKELI